MSRVLIIDDDPGTREGYGAILQDAGFEAVLANSGTHGLELALKSDVDVVLADLRMPDMSAIAILRQLRAAQSNVAFVIVTAFADLPSAIAAVRLGACNYVEKPLIGEQLIEVVQRAVQRHGPHASLDRVEIQPHAITRWTTVIMAVVLSPTDPRTVWGWSRCTGVAPGTLKNWCRTAGLSTRRSLLFARLLRAVLLQKTKNTKTENLLDIVDRRTLFKLLHVAGLANGGTPSLPDDVETFLDKQKLITDGTALSEVRRVIREVHPRTR